MSGIFVEQGIDLKKYRNIPENVFSKRRFSQEYPCPSLETNRFNPATASQNLSVFSLIFVSRALSSFKTAVVCESSEGMPYRRWQFAAACSKFCSVAKPPCFLTKSSDNLEKIKILLWLKLETNCHQAYRRIIFLNSVFSLWSFGNSPCFDFQISPRWGNRAA